MIRRLPSLRWTGYPLSVLAVLGGTAALAYAFRNSLLGIDLDQFALAGRTMLSGHWRHTYDNSFFQAGPFELAVAAISQWVAGSSRALFAIVCDVTAAAVLVAVTQSFVGRRALAVIAVGAGAFALGATRDPYLNGHIADSVNALLWLLAARAARRDRLVFAGLLVGVSAGFELWGILGVSVLLLAPSLRRAALGMAIAGLSTAVWFAPFALAGDFHMFSYQWHVTGGLVGVVLGVGHPFGWPLRVVQGAVTLAVAGVLARKIGTAPVAVYAIPFVTGVCRLVLDPMSITYYWDGTTELALIGAAALVLARRDVRGWLGVAAGRSAGKYGRLGDLTHP